MHNRLGVLFAANLWMELTVEQRIKRIGGEGPPLLFAHANGYPPGSYRKLFAHLEDRFSISALEHRPLWGGRTPPRRLQWKLFADDMLDAMRKDDSEPLWVMGHSMGGVVAALAASREPERFAGLLLLDPVFLPARYALGAKFMSDKRRQQFPLVRRALARPEHFESYQAAYDFYRQKRVFQGMSDDVLMDYVEASKEPRAEGGVQLRFSGAWEAAVYGSAPWVRPVIKKLRVPTLGLRGQDSDVLSNAMMSRWQHWQPNAQLAEIAGGHLFPLEQPLATAQAAIDYVHTGQF